MYSEGSGVDDGNPSNAETWWEVWGLVSRVQTLSHLRAEGGYSEDSIDHLLRDVDLLELWKRISSFGRAMVEIVTVLGYKVMPESKNTTRARWCTAKAASIMSWVMSTSWNACPYTSSSNPASECV